MRIGLVGLGNAGRTLHLPALQGLPGISVSVADSEASRREAAARTGVTAFPSLEALLAAGVPDALIVATPPETHVALCTQALAAGAHVICEKPFASSVADADAILGAAIHAGRRIALNHEFREMPIFRALLDQVGVADVGRPVFLQAWQNMDLPPWKEPSWRGQLLMGVLYEAGLHLVDYALALFGERPVAVTAAMSSCGARAEASDAVALVTLEFSRGRLAQVIQNRLCPGETQYFEVRADCEHASLRASFGGRARISAGLHRSTRPHLRLEVGTSGIAWREAGHARRIIASNPRDPAMVATRTLIRKTLDAFVSGAAPPVTGDQGREVLQVLAACYRSAELGRRVTMDESALIGTVRFGAAAS